MAQTYSTTIRQTHKHMTYEMRRTMEKLLKDRRNTPKHARPTYQSIFEQLGISKSTFYRERERGTVTLIDSEYREYLAYSADVAQDDYESKQAASGPDLKIANHHNVAQKIEDYIIEEELSPYGAAIRLKQEVPNEQAVCERTIYHYIDKGVFLNLSLEHLPRKGKTKRRTKRSMRHVRKNLTAKSITERPIEADNRSELGHWEMDCIESGKGKRATLLTLVDRKSRYTIMVKLMAQTQNEVNRALTGIERKLGKKKFKETFKTITVDNGSEFLNDKQIETSGIGKATQRCQVYYCHPYASYERGSNEQINGHIRRWIPKGSDISQISKKEIETINQRINQCPRKVLNGQNAQEAWEASC